MMEEWKGVVESGTMMAARMREEGREEERSVQLL
jgi:hypothetical protein